MPLAVLIGGLISLSQLASGSELTVTKASGMSTKKAAVDSVAVRFDFAIATVVLADGFPTLSQKAENIKAAAINGKISTGNTGLWLKKKTALSTCAKCCPTIRFWASKFGSATIKRTDPSGRSRISRFKSRRQLAAEKYPPQHIGRR